MARTRRACPHSPLLFRLAPALVVALVSVTSTSKSHDTDSGDGDSNARGVDVNLLFSTPEGDRGLGDMQLAPLVAACVAALVGSVLCVVGHRVLRSAALGCAFFDGAFATAAVLERVLEHAHWEGVASWTFFFLGGIVCCLLVVSVDHGDVACVGVTAGLLAAFTCLTTVGYRIAPAHPELVLYALLVVLGVTSGALTLKIQPVSLIPATSWIGSNMVMWGIGYVFGDYPNGTTMHKFRQESDGKYDLPRAWWGYLAGALICFLLGTCVQASTFSITPKPLSGTRSHGMNTVAPEEGDDYEQAPVARYVSVSTPSSTARYHRGHHVHHVV